MHLQYISACMLNKNIRNTAEISNILSVLIYKYMNLGGTFKKTFK